MELQDMGKMAKLTAAQNDAFSKAMGLPTLKEMFDSGYHQCIHPMCKMVGTVEIVKDIWACDEHNDVELQNDVDVCDECGGTGKVEVGQFDNIEEVKCVCVTDKEGDEQADLIRENRYEA